MSVLGTVATIAGSALLNKLTGKRKDPQIQTASGLTPQQEAMSNALSSYITPRIGTGVEPYTGAGPLDISAYPQIQALAGRDYSDIWAKDIEEPTVRYLKEFGVPIARERARFLTGGPGSYEDYAGRRAALEGLTELGKAKADWTLQGRQQKLTELGALGALETAGIEWDYNQWLRTRPETAPYIQMALSYLDIPMLTAGMTSGYYQPGIGGDLLQGWAASGFQDIFKGGG